jgi:uncharacterized membrane protein
MTNPEHEKRPQTRLGRWRWILIPSLALNLLVIGLIAGIAAKAPEIRRALPPVPPTLMSVVAALPEEEQRRLRHDLRRAFAPEARERRRLEGTAAREEIIVLLQADTFDRAAAESLLTRQGDMLVATYANAVDVLLDTLEGMSPEARKIFAETLTKRGAERWQDRH